MSDGGQEEIQDITPRARKKLYALIGMVVLLISLIGGYGAYAYLQKAWPFNSSGPTAEQIASNAADGYTAAAEDLSDQYIKFDSAFTFNLQGRSGRGHMVQVEVVLLVHGAQNAALAQQHLPLIGGTISEICSQQQYEALAGASGRQRFKRLLLDGIRTKLTGITNSPVVEQVLFVNFVMQ